MITKLQFGPYQWRLLSREAGRVLLITEDIVALRWYHDRFAPVTWRDSAVREFLNTAFIAEFSPEERERICGVSNGNPENPWFRTPGGEATDDAVFLLSLQEVCRYFGDSSGLLAAKGEQRWQLSDEHDGNRIACYKGQPHWWRLRSPGYYDRTSASVTGQGAVYVRGNGVYGTPRDGGGLRPALWLTEG